MGTVSKAEKLLLAFKDLNWDSYIAISDEIVKLDKHDIDGELSRQASMYSYYNGLRAIARKEYERSQLDLAQYMAQTRKRESEDRLLANMKATDKYLEAYVISQPEYRELHEKVVTQNFKLNLITNLVQSLEQKKDMLVQLSANSRAETQIYR